MRPRCGDILSCERINLRATSLMNNLRFAQRYLRQDEVGSQSAKVYSIVIFAVPQRVWKQRSSRPAYQRVARALAKRLYRSGAACLIRPPPLYKLNRSRNWAPLPSLLRWRSSVALQTVRCARNRMRFPSTSPPRSRSSFRMIVRWRRKSNTCSTARWHLTCWWDPETADVGGGQRRGNGDGRWSSDQCSPTARPAPVRERPTDQRSCKCVLPPCIPPGVYDLSRWPDRIYLIGYNRVFLTLGTSGDDIGNGFYPVRASSALDRVCKPECSA